MTRAIIHVLAFDYHKLTRAAIEFKDSEKTYNAIMNQRLGIKIAAMAMECWDRVEEVTKEMESWEKP